MSQLVTGPYEFAYRGTKLGGRTKFAWVDSNLADMPDVVTSDNDLIRRHGELSGLDYLAGRTIELSFELHADDGETFPEVVRQFRDTFAAGAAPSTLSFRNDAIGGGALVSIDCSVRALSIPTDLEFYHGLKIAAVMLRAADPRYYAVDESSIAGLRPPRSTGGRPWSTVWPRQWGTEFFSGTFAAINLGNSNTPVVLTVTGPCVDPAITNLTTGELVKVNANLAAGELLEIDLSGPVPDVRINGTNGYSRVDPASRWFSLAPGTNSLRFESLDGLGSLAVRWRSAWV